MAVKVKIPTQLRAATGGAGELEVSGATVGEVLDALFDRHGELLDDLMARFPALEGQLQYANVYVDGEDIRFTDGLDTPVADGQEVQVLPAVAGG